MTAEKAKKEESPDNSSPDDENKETVMEETVTGFCSMVSRTLPPLPSLTYYSMVAHRVGVGQEQETDPLEDLDKDCRGALVPLHASQGHPG